MNLKKELITKNENNKEKKNQYYYILFIICILLAFIFFIILKNLIIPRLIIYEKKDLLIFDFDKTITEKDTFYEQLILLKSKKEIDELMRRMHYENWIDLTNYVYKRLGELNITVNNINNLLDKLPYHFGMIYFLKNLQKYKDKYYIVLISAGHNHQIKRILDRENLTNIFDEIIGYDCYIDDKGIIKVKKLRKHNCDICNDAQCKTQEYNLLLKKLKKLNKSFNRSIYICDGENDYCLVRNLNKNDIVFCRSGLGLYNILFTKEKLINKVKCQVKLWENGFDLFELFRNLTF